MPELIGHLITKYLRRHPFEGVSFCLSPFVAIKTALFLAAGHQQHALARKTALFLAANADITLWNIRIPR